MGVAQVPLWNVPYQRNPLFTGREDVLKRLSEALRAGKTTALAQPQAISGLGGIGKTQTAVEYAHRYRVVLWVKAETQGSINSDFVTIAHLLNLAEKQEQDQHKIVEAVKRWFQGHTEWLLIFDNADDLAMVQGFLPLGSKGHILLTTRAHATGRIAQRIEVEKMDPDEGALFLLHRSTLLDSNALLEAAQVSDRNTAREIVKAMDGLPLALEQANAAAAQLLRFCAFLAPDAIPEELFTESAAELGPMLEPVASDHSGLNAAIRELLKYSLVQRDPEAQTLSIHRLVQEVLKDQMNEDVQREWAERAIRAVNRAFPAVEFENWDHCLRMLTHAQTCADLITQRHIELPEASSLLYQTGSFLYAHGQYVETEPFVQGALAIGEQVFGPDHLFIATTLDGLANLYQDQGKYAEAEPLYQRSLAIQEQTLVPEHLSTEHTLEGYATLLRQMQRTEEAAQLEERAGAIRARRAS